MTPRILPRPRDLPETIDVEGRVLRRSSEGAFWLYSDESKLPYFHVASMWTGGPWRVEAWWAPEKWRVARVDSLDKVPATFVRLLLEEKAA
jgi:hypothetical protein